eukprot:3963137-Pleurochrysis_carterae.AAC.2
MARHSMPTAYAMSGRVLVEQYSSAPTRLWDRRVSTSSLAESSRSLTAFSTRAGRSARGNACRRVCSEELLDVRGLPQYNVVAFDRDIDVEKVGHFSFVIDAPAVDEGRGELSIETAGVVGRVEDEKSST